MVKKEKDDSLAPQGFAAANCLIRVYNKSYHDKDIKMFSEGFELYIHNSSIIEGKNDQLKDFTA